MSVLTELGDYLVAHGIGNMTSSPPTLYLGSHPDMPDRLITLTEYPGGPPEYDQGSTFPIAEVVNVQVVTRALRYQDADEDARKVWSALCVITNATLSGTYYRSVRPHSSPGLMGRDSHDRVRIYFNMSIEKEVSDVAIS